MIIPYKMKLPVMALLAGVILCQGCSKEVLVTSGKKLGERTVDADAGEFPVMVTTTGAWQAYSLSDWIDVDESLHKDKGSFSVKYEANTSYYGKTLFNRLGKVVVATCDGAQADTLVLKQRGLDPSISFAAENVISLEGGAVSVNVQSNLGDTERSGLSFNSDAEWISGINWGADGKSISFTAQKGDSQRSAVITVSFTPQWGEEYTAQCNIIQK